MEPRGLVYVRQGGMAGLCDRMTIDPEGSVEVTGRPGGTRGGRLTAEQRATLDRLLAEWHATAGQRPHSGPWPGKLPDLMSRLGQVLPVLVDNTCMQIRHAGKVADLTQPASEAVRRLHAWLEQLAAQLPITHCPKCGYDLRATPRRCPECGTCL